MVALPFGETLENGTRYVKRETPKIGGSSAAFVVIIVALVLIIVIACTAIALLLREEAHASSEPTERGWRSWIAGLFSTKPKEPSSPVMSMRDRRLSILSQKGQGWLQAGQEGEWDSKYLKVNPGAVSPNSTISARGKAPPSPHDPNSALPGNLFGSAASVHDRPSVDITTEPSTTPTPMEGHAYPTNVLHSPTTFHPAPFDSFIPNIRSHLSSSPSLSTMATHYTHAGSDVIVTVPPSSSAHESDDSPVARAAARGSKFIESL